MNKNQEKNLEFENLYLPAFTYFFSKNISSSDYNEYCNNVNNNAFIEKYIADDFFNLSNSKITINYELDFIRYLKISYDYFLIQKLPEYVSKKIFDKKQEIFNNFTDIQSIILIGSAARNSLTDKSDIDIYVILNEPNIGYRKQKSSNIQVLINTSNSFKQKVMCQDELAIWVLKYGLILYDNNFIFKYYQNEYQIGSQVLNEKLRLIYMMHNKLNFSHLISQSKQFQYIRKMIYHMARYVLILNNEIPLSKSEIPLQLFSYDSYLSSKIQNFEKLNLLAREELQLFSSEVFNYFENRYLLDSSAKTR